MLQRSWLIRTEDGTGGKNRDGLIHARAHHILHFSDLKKDLRADAAAFLGGFNHHQNSGFTMPMVLFIRLAIFLLNFFKLEVCPFPLDLDVFSVFAVAFWLGLIAFGLGDLEVHCSCCCALAAVQVEGGRIVIHQSGSS